MKRLKRYIVDSDILIDGLRKIPGAAEYMDSLGDWSYSIASAMELFSGARSKKEIRDIEKSLAAYRRIPLTQDLGERALQLLRKYAKSDGMGAFDAIIAATAIDEDLTLSTRNRKHFKNVKNLRLEIAQYPSPNREEISNVEE